MVKKSTKAKTQDHQEIKPPSIEEARDALLFAVACWLDCVGDYSVKPYPKTLDAFLKHADRLDDLNYYWLQLLLADHQEGSWADGPRRPFDSVLDMKSGHGEETAIEIISGISHLIRSLSSEAISRDTVIDAARRQGLPSNLIEARALLGKVTLAMQTPESNEKYPGLKQKYMELKDKGYTWKEIATQYVIGHYGRGVEDHRRLTEAVASHLKYRVNQLNDWEGKRALE
jgi:hypothetical protein